MNNAVRIEDQGEMIEEDEKDLMNINENVKYQTLKSIYRRSENPENN